MGPSPHLQVGEVLLIADVEAEGERGVEVLELHGLRVPALHRPHVVVAGGVGLGLVLHLHGHLEEEKGRRVTVLSAVGAEAGH